MHIGYNYAFRDINVTAIFLFLKRHSFELATYDTWKRENKDISYIYVRPEQRKQRNKQ